MLLYTPEPGPIPKDEHDRLHTEWTNRELERIGRFSLTAHDLDALHSPDLIKGKPQPGMVRYFEDTPLGYGPGPYCYVCLPDTPSQGQQTCYWRPMFPVRNNYVEDVQGAQAIGIPSQVWTTVATIGLDQRMGRRTHVGANVNGGTSGRTDIQLGYRIVVNPGAVFLQASPLNGFGFNHEFSNVNVDQYIQTHTVSGYTQPQWAASKQALTFELQAYSDIVGTGNVATVNDWFFYAKED